MTGRNWLYEEQRQQIKEFHRLQTWQQLRDALETAKKHLGLYCHEDDGSGYYPWDEVDDLVMGIITAALEAAKEE